MISLLRKQVIIDTDLGVDDAHAVALALKSPELDIKGITTIFGNADVKYCTDNVLYVLELMEIQGIDVRQGSAKPLLGEKYYGVEILKTQLKDALREKDDIRTNRLSYESPHGVNGLGDFKTPSLRTVAKNENAIMWLVKTVLDNPGEMQILALGPLTNIALACLIEPTWAKKVKSLVFMGGAITVPGNVAPLSTANISNDPEAAKIVFNARFPEIVMVGQDVTRDALLAPEHIEYLNKLDTPLSRFLVDITKHYAEFYIERNPKLRKKGVPIHDLVASYYMVTKGENNNNYFKSEKFYVTVETHGEITRGQTVADRRDFSPYTKQMDVCMDVDHNGLFSFYLERISK